MLQKIINSSIKNKLIVGIFTLGLIIYGIIEVFKLPIDAVPDITNNQVQIITTSTSLGAPDVERLITFPIEQANYNIPGLHEIRSFSRFGLSLVTIVFHDDVDIYWARQQVAERLIQAQQNIPPGLGTPFLAPVTTGLGEIYQYVVKPKKGFESKYNATELRTIQDWIVRRQLLGVKGVADVSSFGGKVKQYEIAVNPSKLTALNLSVADVLKAVEQNNQNTGGSYIEKSNRVHFIRTEGLVGSIEDIQNICLNSESHTKPIYIRDVAEVQLGNANRYGAMAYNDQGEVAGAIVMMLKGENSREVIAAVKERIERIKQTLPEGIEIEPFLDRTKMVNNAISTVSKNLTEGAIIVIFVLVLILGNFRAGLLVASVIPLAMLFAIIMMNLFGVSGNLMSLGALDFGLIVDGAVIIVEAVLHQIMKRKHDPNKINQIVGDSAGKMMNSAVFGQIIILVVYLPIFSLEGIEGKMFKPMAQTVAFALLGAFILSLTYIPMMSSVIFKNTSPSEDNITERTFKKLQNFYQKVLQWIFKNRKIAIGSTLGLFVISIILGSTLGGEFIPTLEEGDFAVESRVMIGSNLNTTLESTQKAAGILKREFPEVEKVVSKIGSGEIPTDPMPIEAADMMIILKDKSEWTSAKTFDELAEKMQAKIASVPGLSTGFQYPVQMRFNELMTGAKQDVVCKIFGEDLDTLSKYAELLGEISHKVDGATDVYVEATQGMPQLVVKFNRDLLAQYQGNITDINRIINATFAGEVTGQVFEGEKRFDMVVRIANSDKNSIEALENLLVPVGNNKRIPLNLIATIESFDGVNQIQREDAKRRIIVGFNIAGKDVQTVVKELQANVQKRIKLPPGYYITYGGSFENLEKAKSRLSIAVPIALFLIFGLLFFAFHSVKQGLLIYTAIPLSAMGGLMALFLRDMPFSISAGIGFIALFGVAVLNGIVLIAEFNRLRENSTASIEDIVLEGTRTRLRPVLITALVASLGLLPMALSSGSGAEVQKPLATVVIGGLLVATMLSLLILPLLYIIFEKRNKVKHHHSATVIAICLISFGNLNAQSALSMSQLVDSAVQNNLSLKIEIQLLNYQHLGIKQNGILGETQFNANYGQINSYYRDNQYAIQQSIGNPLVQMKLRKIGQQQVDIQKNQIEITTKQLIYAVQELYLINLYLSEKKRTLEILIQLIQVEIDKTQNRIKIGLSSGNELWAIELQRNRIVLQQEMVKNEIVQAKTNLKNLTRIKQDFNFLDSFTDNSISTLKNYQPIGNLEVIKQSLTTELTKKQLEIEKLKRLPKFSLGYTNQSFAGYQNIYGKDRFFNTGNRFHSAQLSMSLPLFFAGQKQKIGMAAIEYDIAQKRLELEKDLFNNQRAAAIEQVKNIHEVYDTKKPEYQDQIIRYQTIAEKQLKNGEINLIEWSRLQEQSLDIRLSLLDLQYQYQKSILNLNQYHEK